MESEETSLEVSEVYGPTPDDQVRMRHILDGELELTTSFDSFRTWWPRIAQFMTIDPEAASSWQVRRVANIAKFYISRTNMFVDDAGAWRVEDMPDEAKVDDFLNATQLFSQRINIMRAAEVQNPAFENEQYVQLWGRKKRSAPRTVLPTSNTQFPLSEPRKSSKPQLQLGDIGQAEDTRQSQIGLFEYQFYLVQAPYQRYIQTGETASTFANVLYGKDFEPAAKIIISGEEVHSNVQAVLEDKEDMPQFFWDSWFALGVSNSEGVNNPVELERINGHPRDCCWRDVQNLSLVTEAILQMVAFFEAHGEPFTIEELAPYHFVLFEWYLVRWTPTINRIARKVLSKYDLGSTPIAVIWSLLKIIANIAQPSDSPYCSTSSSKSWWKARFKQNPRTMHPHVSFQFTEAIIHPAPHLVLPQRDFGVDAKVNLFLLTDEADEKLESIVASKNKSKQADVKWVTSLVAKLKAVFLTNLRSFFTNTAAVADTPEDPTTDHEDANILKSREDYIRSLCPDYLDIRLMPRWWGIRRQILCLISRYKLEVSSLEEELGLDRDLDSAVNLARIRLGIDGRPEEGSAPMQQDDLVEQHPSQQDLAEQHVANQDESMVDQVIIDAAEQETAQDLAEQHVANQDESMVDQVIIDAAEQETAQDLAEQHVANQDESMVDQVIIDGAEQENPAQMDESKSSGLEGEEPNSLGKGNVCRDVEEIKAAYFSELQRKAASLKQPLAYDIHWGKK